MSLYPAEIHLATPGIPPDDLRPGEIHAGRDVWLLGCPWCGAILDLGDNHFEIDPRTHRVTLEKPAECPRCRKRLRVESGRVVELDSFQPRD